MENAGVFNIGVYVDNAAQRYKEFVGSLSGKIVAKKAELAEFEHKNFLQYSKEIKKKSLFLLGFIAAEEQLLAALRECHSTFFMHFRALEDVARKVILAEEKPKDFGHAVNSAILDAMTKHLQSFFQLNFDNRFRTAAESALNDHYTACLNLFKSSSGAEKDGLEDASAFQLGKTAAYQEIRNELHIFWEGGNGLYSIAHEYRAACFREASILS